MTRRLVYFQSTLDCKFHDRIDNLLVHTVDTVSSESPPRLWPAVSLFHKKYGFLSCEFFDHLVVVGLPFLEFQCNRVDAVSLAGRLRTVLEDVSQVSLAVTAMYLVAHHQPTAILG